MSECKDFTVKQVQSNSAKKKKKEKRKKGNYKVKAQKEIEFLEKKPKEHNQW